MKVKQLVCIPLANDKYSAKKIYVFKARCIHQHSVRVSITIYNHFVNHLYTHNIFYFITRIITKSESRKEYSIFRFKGCK